jgi:hypothetical protein
MISLIQEQYKMPLFILVLINFKYGELREVIVVLLLMAEREVILKEL